MTASDGLSAPASILELQVLSAAVTAAGRCGLFDALRAGPASSAADYAARLGLDPLATELILEVLAEFGIATSAGARYSAAPALVLAGATFNQASMPGYLEQMPAFLTSGERWTAMGSSSELREDVYRRIVCALGRYLADAAAELAASLPGSPQYILDVGAGSGVWSFAMAELHPKTRVTGMDFANVLPSFEAWAQEAGLSDRADTLEGDYFSVEVPGERFDRIVISHVLHLETPERAEALLRRIARALAPGGDLVIVENTGGGSATRRRAHAIYRLHRALRTTGPGPHAWSKVRGWLRGAGLTPGRLIPLKSFPYGLSALTSARKDK